MKPIEDAKPKVKPIEEPKAKVKPIEEPKPKVKPIEELKPKVKPNVTNSDARTVPNEPKVPGHDAPSSRASQKVLPHLISSRFLHASSRLLYKIKINIYLIKALSSSFSLDYTLRPPVLDLFKSLLHAINSGKDLKEIAKRLGFIKVKSSPYNSSDLYDKFMAFASMVVLLL